MQQNSSLCQTEEVKGEPLIDKVISAVKGGSPQSAAAMKSQLSKDGVLDWTHYVEWARTLADLPAIIHSDVKTHSLIAEQSLYFVGVFQISLYTI